MRPTDSDRFKTFLAEFRAAQDRARADHKLRWLRDVDPQPAQTGTRLQWLSQVRELHQSSSVQTLIEAMHAGLPKPENILQKAPDAVHASQSSQSTAKAKPGRPPRSRQQISDEDALVDEVIALSRGGMTFKEAQERVAPKLYGGGTLLSKIDRLRKLRGKRR